MPIFRYCLFNYAMSDYLTSILFAGRRSTSWNGWASSAVWQKLIVCKILKILVKQFIWYYSVNARC